MAGGEVAEDCDAVFEAEDRLGDVTMVLEEFWVYSDVADLFKQIFTME